MSLPVPVQVCNCTKEELLAKYKEKDIGDECPLCRKAGYGVDIGFHRSQTAAGCQSNSERTGSTLPRNC